jgi:biotin carboxyl carrier protein
VKVGQEVKKGDALVLLEAMKMEHVIRATKDAVVKQIFYKDGDLVGEKKQLVVLE